MTKFFIVGTPIGNFDDITLRAIETLKKVDIIACEDTRVTKNLLNHFSIYDKKLISYHKYNETISSQKIIDILLNENKSVALVSDAGMPTISDPGFVLVESIKKHNISFEVIPGVSAITTIMAISGFGPDFTFLGFGKMKKSQLENQIKNLTEGTYLFFCAPNKMEFLISTIEKYHKDSSVAVGREMTKKFETFYFGSPAKIKEQINQNYRGEFSLVFKITKTKKEKINKYKIIT